MPNHRAKTIAKYQFPIDWTPAESQAWLAVANKVQNAKDEMKTVVLVTGVFDLLHEEHRKFLRKSRAIGNFLVVGIESDQRVRELKGPDRPVEAQAIRANNVFDTGVVDVVEILPEAFSRPEHHRSLLGLLRPHLLAVSSNSPFMEAKRQLMELFGGELRVVLEHNPKVSTTKILKKRTLTKS